MCKKDSSKTKMSLGWVGVLAIILLFAVAFFVLAIKLREYFGFEISDSSVVISFVGIMATFIVVSNYIQLKRVEDKVEGFEKRVNELEKKFKDAVGVFGKFKSDFDICSDNVKKIETNNKYVVDEIRNLNDSQKSIKNYLNLGNFGLREPMLVVFTLENTIITENQISELIKNPCFMEIVRFTDVSTSPIGFLEKLFSSGTAQETSTMLLEWEAYIENSRKISKFEERHRGRRIGVFIVNSKGKLICFKNNENDELSPIPATIVADGGGFSGTFDIATMQLRISFGFKTNLDNIHITETKIPIVNKRQCYSYNIDLE